jgi:hypothetical protein
VVKGQTGAGSTGSAIKDVRSVRYYSIAGRIVSSESKGLLIRKITYSDGTTKAKKALTK